MDALLIIVPSGCGISIPGIHGCVLIAPDGIDNIDTIQASPPAAR